MGYDVFIVRFDKLPPCDMGTFSVGVAMSMVDSGSPGKLGPAIDFRAIAAKYGLEFPG
jgi:hypothetical protein